MNYDEKYADSLGVEHHREVIKRLQLAIAKADLDALVVFRPDFFHWINTHQSVFIDGGMLGMAMLIIPREGEPVGICSEHEYDAMLERAAVRDWRAVQFWTGQEDRYANPNQPAIIFLGNIFIYTLYSLTVSLNLPLSTAILYSVPSSWIMRSCMVPLAFSSGVSSTVTFISSIIEFIS